MKRLLYLLLGLLGISATGCDFMRVEYGTPHVHFNLKARVIDEAGKPIEGIEARVKESWGDYYQHFDNRTGVTNYLGEIDAHTSNMFSMDHTIIFLDPDGEANGGEFETLTVDIENATQTEEGSDSWYDGAYTADMGTVTMKLKEKSEENTDTPEE